MDKQTIESQNLDRFSKFIEDMNSTNSSLEKSAKLSTYAGDDYVKKALLYTYDPYRKYNVTVANLEKNPDLIETKSRGESLFGLLDALDSRACTGHAAIARVNSFIADNFLFTKAIHAVLDRNLKIRVDVAEINKVFPDLIPVFDVALAKAFTREMLVPGKNGKTKVDFARDAWYASRKLDGLRCICIIDEAGAVTFCSRKGHEYHTLSVLRREIETWGLRSVVFDGELCLIDAAGKEDFPGIMKVYKKKDFTIPNPRYKMFDMLTLQEFRAGKGTVTLSARFANLKSAADAGHAITGNSTIATVLEQGRIRDIAHLGALLALVAKNGWEGLMLRLDAPYVGTRSSDLLKCKEMKDAEYVVVGLESDMITSTFYRDMITGEELDRVDGEYVQISNGCPVDFDVVQAYSDTRMMVSKLVINHRGNQVGVGSGLSMMQRREWHNDNSLIIGKTVTIQYFEETEVDGRMSLRFPVLKWKYEGERDV